MKTTLLFIVMISLLGCAKREIRNCGFPRSLVFRFVFVNEAGEDLFFGPNAKYDYRNIKQIHGDTAFLVSDAITPLQVYFGENPHFRIRTLAFHILIETTRTFLFEFFPGKTDTIVFKASKEQTIIDFCYPGEVLRSFDIYFNGKLICTNCTPSFDISQFQIHKIVIK